MSWDLHKIILTRGMSLSLLFHFWALRFVLKYSVRLGNAGHSLKQRGWRGMKCKLFVIKYLNPNKKQGMREDVPIPANEHILLWRVEKPLKQIWAGCASWLQQGDSPWWSGAARQDLNLILEITVICTELHAQCFWGRQGAGPQADHLVWIQVGKELLDNLHCIY